MPGKQKSEWSKKRDELKGQLPKDFDGREFRSCRVDGKVDKESIAKVCAGKGFKDKADAIYSFLTHMDSKPAKVGRKSGPKKQTAESITDKILLSTRTYKTLSASQIEKLIGKLSELQKSRKEKEIVAVKARIEKDQKELKELQTK